jgi:dipeptidyl aminopeptidase/acylaminoacyl peptidase
MNGRRGLQPVFSPFAATLVLVVLACVAGGAENPRRDGNLLEQRSVDIAKVAADAPYPATQKRIHGAAARVTLSWITYASDGLEVSGYLAMPREGAALPCVIFNRGGAGEYGALTDLEAAAILMPIAARGYVVVAPQYRGNDGGEGQEEYGGADVNDVLNLVPFLERLDRADASRIGIYGWSRGGMMTYLALARSKRFSAAVVMSGISDFSDFITRRPEIVTQVLAPRVPEWATQREIAIRKRSAILWASQLPADTPILILHGSDDTMVAPEQSLRMAQALRDAGRRFRLILFEGGDHGLNGYGEEADAAILSWLDRYVRDAAPARGLNAKASEARASSGS